MMRTAFVVALALVSSSVALAASGSEPRTSVALAQSSLSLEASCSPNQVRPQEQAVITCRTEITNAGDAASSRLWVRLPRDWNEALAFPFFAIFDRSINRQPVSLEVGEADFTLPALEPGGTIEIKDRIIVYAEEPGTYGIRFNLNDEGDFAATADLRFEARLDAAFPPSHLAVTKSFSWVEDPEVVDYEMVVVNTATTTATNVTVLNRPSSNFVLVSAEPEPSATDKTTGVLSWSVDALPPGEDDRITIRLAPSELCAYGLQNAMVVEAEVGGAAEEYGAFYRTTEHSIIGPDECRPAPLPTPTPQPPPDGLIQLALGDSVMAGCCSDPEQGVAVLFSHYLSGEYGQRVNLFNLASASSVGWTAEGLISNEATWPSGRRGTTLEEAAALLGEARRRGGTVLAITLDIGGNDFLFLRDPETNQSCYLSVTAACVQAFSRALETYRGNLDRILDALVQAKAQETPLLLMNYYNPFDTGDDTTLIQVVEGAVGAINAVIAEEAAARGASLIDVHPLFAGRSADLISGVDPTEEGHRVLAQAFVAAYESALHSHDATPPPVATATPTILRLPVTGTGGSSRQVAFPAIALLAAIGLLLLTRNLLPRREVG
jgi:uncharacterized repeat protein (TIGR01451 family)